MKYVAKSPRLQFEDFGKFVVCSNSYYNSYYIERKWKVGITEVSLYLNHSPYHCRPDNLIQGRRGYSVDAATASEDGTLSDGCRPVDISKGGNLRFFIWKATMSFAQSNYMSKWVDNIR